MSPPISLARLFRLIPDASPLDRDPEWALRKLSGLEQNRSLYKSLGFAESVQATENKIQALFRPFDRDQYLLNVARIGIDLRSPDPTVFSTALDQARQLPNEYAPFLLRGLALNLRKEAEEIDRTQRRNELSMKALEAVATVEVEAHYQDGHPQTAERLGQELREILTRIAQSLRSGQTLLEAVGAERAAHPASPFVEMYLERGLSSLVSAISQASLDEGSFRNRLLDYAEILERDQGLYSGARILAESLVDSSGEIHQRAQAILNRIPEEEEIDGRYRFILNLGLVTADSNLSVLKLGATAMSFAAAGGLASAAESGSAAWLSSGGASEAAALLGSRLVHSATMGAIQPLLAPGAEHLNGNSYIEQFVHMSGLTGILGIRGALMRNTASPLLHYATTIGAMTGYDYITQAEIRKLPFGLNLANVVGNDLLMHSGESLASLRSRMPQLSLSKIEFRIPEPTFGLSSALLFLSGCEARGTSLRDHIGTWLGLGLGALAMVKNPWAVQETLTPAAFKRLLQKLDDPDRGLAMATFQELIQKHSLPRTAEVFEAIRGAHQRFPKLFLKTKNLAIRDRNLLILSSYLEEAESRTLLEAARQPKYVNGVLLSEILKLDAPWREHEIEYMFDVKLGDARDLAKFPELFRSGPIPAKLLGRIQALFTKTWDSLRDRSAGLGYRLNPIVDGQFVARDREFEPMSNLISDFGAEDQDIINLYLLVKAFGDISANSEIRPAALRELRTLLKSGENLNIGSRIGLDAFIAEIPLAKGDEMYSLLDLLEFRSRFRYLFTEPLTASERYIPLPGADLSKFLETALVFAKRIYQYSLQSGARSSQELRESLKGPAALFPFRQELEALIGRIVNHPDLNQSIGGLIGLLDPRQRTSSLPEIPITLTVGSGEKSIVDRNLIDGLLEAFVENRSLTSASIGLINDFAGEAWHVSLETLQKIQKKVSIPDAPTRKLAPD